MGRYAVPARQLGLHNNFRDASHRRSRPGSRAPPPNFRVHRAEHPAAKDAARIRIL